MWRKAAEHRVDPATDRPCTEASTSPARRNRTPSRVDLVIFTVRAELVRAPTRARRPWADEPRASPPPGTLPGRISGVDPRLITSPITGARRSVSDPADIAIYVCFGPTETCLAMPPTVFRAERDCDANRGQCGRVKAQSQSTIVACSGPPDEC